MLEIYLDNNATTPILPQAAAAAAMAMTSHFGNPSSTHISGLQARSRLDAARQRAKRVLGAGDGQLVFTSGATEGIQIAVLSALNAARQRVATGQASKPLKLLYGATEHKAVSESIRHWSQLLGVDCDIMAIPVDANGGHDLNFLRAHAASAALICTMAVNNETGVISDLAGIERALLACDSSALWLVDAVQALGKMKLDLCTTRIDYATFSGHKLYAPKGIGMLYARAGAPITPIMVGGGQESALRSGTENMAGIAALDAVLELLENRDPVFQDTSMLYSFRSRLVAALIEAFPGIVMNAPLDLSVPTTLNFSVPDMASKELLDLFDSAGIRVSSGSACSSSVAAPSYVLRAMHVGDAYAASAVRMSFGPATTEADIAAACTRIVECGAALRSACLVPAEQAEIWRQDGLLRLESQGACCWLLADAASGNCIIIDPVAALLPRIEHHVRGQNLQVLAILETQPRTGHASARTSLAAMLADKMTDASGSDNQGWPHAGAVSITLDSGEQTQALQLGNLALTRTSISDSNHHSGVYLAGTAIEGKLAATAARYAFTGDALPLNGMAHASALDSAQAIPDALNRLAAVAGDSCIICPAHDHHTQLITTLGSERRGLSLPSDQQPANSFAADGLAENIHIEPGLIRDLSHDLPDTLLIDVREAYEHHFISATGFDTPVLNVPLSQLASHAGAWLNNTDQALIFFCRSGKRGEAAARCLRRLGHAKAWSLAGNVA
ncbi:aminotransferase class V-fold PLP-dependent enzyme [Undibacterium sp.]|uniref:aminotransferase class V-fold PLP-dependent enzyme n=1 Tax=Undibacterium sp. TaxID=1914977 RepID=UPI00374D4D20